MYRTHDCAGAYMHDCWPTLFVCVCVCVPVLCMLWVGVVVGGLVCFSLCVCVCVFQQCVEEQDITGESIDSNF